MIKKSNFFLKNIDLTFLICFTFGILLFAVNKLVSLGLSIEIHWHLKLFFYLILFLGLTFVRYNEIDYPLLMGLYFFYLFIIFYIYFSPPHISSDELESLSKYKPISIFIIEWQLYISIFFLIASFFRPLLGFFILIIFFYKKKIINEYYGVNISSTDWLNVYEFFIFFIFLIFAQQIFLKAKLLKKIKYIDFRNLENKQVQFYFFLACVSIHFASYFYSGVAKAGLIQHLSNVEYNTWLLNNDTNNIILASWYAKTFPLADFANLSSQIYKLALAINVPFNFIVLFSQIFCIICFFQISLIKFFCIIFDIIHISIFFLTGIFFWKWITLNLIIFFIVRKYENININYFKKFILIFLILFSYKLFFVAKLAWFDSKSMNASFFEAVDYKGKVYRVPSNYFGSISLPVAQMRLGREFSGYFKTGVYASVYNYKYYDKFNKCFIKTSNQIEALNEKKIQQIKKILLGQHRYVLEKIDNSGRIKYDNYAHHIWSNPLEFKEFYKLDKRDIKSYNYVVQAVCLHFNDNEFKPIVLKQDIYEIDIN